jgi:hypothetical protein
MHGLITLQSNAIDFFAQLLLPKLLNCIVPCSPIRELLLTFFPGCHAAKCSTLEPPLFNIFINGLWTKMRFSQFILFADDLKIFWVMESADNCNLLQFHIDFVQSGGLKIIWKLKYLKQIYIILLGNPTVSIIITFWVIY